MTVLAVDFPFWSIGSSWSSAVANATTATAPASGEGVVASIAAVTHSTALVNPVSGKSLRLLNCTISVDTPGTYQIQDGINGTAVAAVALQANAPFSLDLTLPDKVELDVPNAKAGRKLTAGNALCAIGPNNSNLAITATVATE